MTRQRETLPYLIQRCCEVDPHCGIQLQGSVARKMERYDSDVDLCVVLDSAKSDYRFNEFLNHENHGTQIRVTAGPTEVDVDINWIYEQELIEISESSRSIWWYMFASGRPIHDPAGRAARCQTALLQWNDRYPEIVHARERQQIEWDMFKKDRNHRLEFPTQAEFCAYLESLIT